MGFGRCFPLTYSRLKKGGITSWIFFICLLALSSCLSIWIIHNIEQLPQGNSKQSVDFATATNAYDIRRTLLKRVWPAFRGYPTGYVSEGTNPSDPILLNRIEISQAAIKTPLGEILMNGRAQSKHAWRFEKIIHQTWKSENIPIRTAPWVKRWLQLHPDWIHMFWTDRNSLEFIKQYYPALLPVYTSWTVPVQKADMFRLLVLYTFGGIYADLDVEPLKPLDEIRNWSSCILSREHDLQTFVMVNDLNYWANNYTFTCNAFMACKSHHPFLYYLLGRISLRSPFISSQACHLEQTILCTGPLFVSLGYGFYIRSVSEETRLLRRETDVIVPTYEYFLPTFDQSRLSLARVNCEKKVISAKQKEVCDIWKDRGYKNEPLAYSFTNHHQFHSYHRNVSDSSISIHDVTETIIWSRRNEQNNFHITFV